MAALHSANSQLLATSRKSNAIRTWYSSQFLCISAYWVTAAAPHDAAVTALMLQYKGGNRSLTPAQIFSTLANTAIDMDYCPSTVGFDVGFDFGTGSGLVHASAAFHAHTPTGPVSPAPVPALQAPVPTRRPCGFLRGRIFCPWAFCRRMFGRLFRDCRTSSRVFVVIFPGSKYHRRVWSLQKFIS
jgi:hypothetical protein